MSLPLEDQFNDVLNKAARGLVKGLPELTAATGISSQKIRTVFDGNFDAEIVKAIAEPLGLATGPLVALGEEKYRPAPVALDGLMQSTTPFDDMTVNAYLVWDAAAGVAAIFDTGSDGDGLLEKARELGMRVEQIFITHSHGDHVYDLDRLMEKTGAIAWAPKRDEVNGATTFAAGKSFQVGSLTVETRLTWGHAQGGVTYVVRGLAKPLAICGDAMFAGSMGGGMVSYADALRTNREEILTLPPATILAPGHGPMTTVGEELSNNPFFPALT